MVFPGLLAAVVRAAPAHAAAQPARAVAPTLYDLLLANALNFVAAIVILVVGWTLSVWVRRWIRSAFLHVHVLDRSLGPVLASMARYGILILTVMAMLSRFGVQMTSLIAVIGAAGIAIGLALQGTLANVASGLMILLLRPFRVGDIIAVLDEDAMRGTVQEIGLFRTLIKAFDYRSLSVPNVTLFAGTIVNFTAEDRFRIDIKVPVDLVNDVAAVRRLFAEVVARELRILKEPAPAVGIDELTDYQAIMLVRFFVPYAQRNPIAWDVREALHTAMRQNGIAIAVPRQAAQQRSERNLNPALTGEEPAPEPAKLRRVAEPRGEIRSPGTS